MRNLRIKILGLDPGMAHLGLARLVFDEEDGVDGGASARTLEDVLHIPTIKGPGVEAKEDDRRRIREITTAYVEALRDFEPDVVAFETPPFVRNARSSAQISGAWYACYALTIHLMPDVLVVSLDPHSVKMAACGIEGASKVQVFEGIVTKFPEFDGWPVPVTQVFTGEDSRAHLADACGAALAAYAHERVRRAVRYWTRNRKLEIAARDLLSKEHAAPAW